MASGVHVMEKPIQLQHHQHQHQHQHQHHQQQQQQQQQQQHQPHEALKCPRCDSSNTKFCYYNNYSLSQPRHFCKACKRYWTRGGTLRNVPVGGGCRKNKRVKRPISNTVHAVTNTNPTPNPHPNPNSHSRDHNQTTSNSNSNHHLNPLFYGLLPQNPNYVPRSETRVSTGQESTTLLSGYDLLQPHMNVAGLGFSSLGQGGNSFMGHNTNLTFSSYNSSMYGDGSTSSSTSMASLLASSLGQQQRFVGFAPYDGGGGGSSMVKDLKMEEPPNRMEWNNNNNNNNFHKDDQIEGVVSSDPNSLLWDTDGGGWLDPTTNIGSSVPSLI